VKAEVAILDAKEMKCIKYLIPMNNGSLSLKNYTNLLSANTINVINPRGHMMNGNVRYYVRPMTMMNMNANVRSVPILDPMKRIKYCLANENGNVSDYTIRVNTNMRYYAGNTSLNTDEKNAQASASNMGLAHSENGNLNKADSNKKVDASAQRGNHAGNFFAFGDVMSRQNEQQALEDINSRVEKILKKKLEMMGSKEEVYDPTRRILQQLALDKKYLAQALKAAVQELRLTTFQVQKMKDVLDENNIKCDLSAYQFEGKSFQEFLKNVQGRSTIQGLETDRTISRDKMDSEMLAAYELFF